MEVLKNIYLGEYTTLRIGGPAKYFIRVKNLQDLHDALDFAKKENLLTNNKILFLGSGSNMLVSDSGFDGLVLSIENEGIEIIEEDSDFVFVNIAAGEIWDEVVSWAVDNGFGGIENMSAIPGKVGAFAVQNVGAYGQDASQVLDSVRVVDISNGESKIFNNNQCKFAYRKSIFNSEEKGRYLIFSIVLKLSKNPIVNLKYKDVANYFGDNQAPTLKEVRQAIIAIRSAKLPDPKNIGNAGSFFKNVLVDQTKFEEVSKKIAANFGLESQKKLITICKAQGNGEIKIPSAFLIELCGLKGYSIGSAKIYEKHALVLVNSGTAKATDILNLAEYIKKTVNEKCGALLECEPNFIGFSDQEVVGLPQLSTNS